MTTKDLIHSYSYDSLIYKSQFGIAACFKVEETNFNKLEKLAKNDVEPLKYAGKAAILYGIPGLLLYIDVCTKQLEISSQQNEMVGQSAIQLLAKLSFSKEMLCTIKEKKAVEAMDALMPLEQYNEKDYWEDKFYRIIALLEKSSDYDSNFITNEIKNISKTLISSCVPLAACRQDIANMGL